MGALLSHVAGDVKILRRSEERGSFEVYEGATRWMMEVCPAIPGTELAAEDYLAYFGEGGAAIVGVGGVRRGFFADRTGSHALRIFEPADVFAEVCGTAAVLSVRYIEHYLRASEIVSRMRLACAKHQATGS